MSALGLSDAEYPSPQHFSGHFAPAPQRAARACPAII